MHIEIKKEPFNPYIEIDQYRQKMKCKGKFGATASFVGSMRDYNEEKEVTEMQLEFYPGMTEKHLSMICKNASERWDLIDILVMHRVGRIEIGEPIVLVSVWSAHRAAAFDACRFIMEDLKSRAPFWKQECLTDGKRWVEKNTP